MSIKENGLKVNSTVFSHNGHIPFRYTCEGDNINPPLEISNMPDGTKTLALIVEDPDAPSGTFDHWLVWNIRPNEPIGEQTNVGIRGTNSFGKRGYGGPCPPSGTHRYFFKVYALDCELDLAGGANKKELLYAIKGHILDTGELIGLYQKRKIVAAK